MQHRIIMLRIRHAILLGYMGFLSSIEHLHSTLLQHLSDPGRTIITLSLLRVLSKDSYMWEQIHHIVTIFIVAVGSLLDTLDLQDDLPEPRVFRELLIENRVVCAEL